MIRPFAEELQVFVVSVCEATAVQPAGGPTTAVAVTVTFCDAVPAFGAVEGEVKPKVPATDADPPLRVEEARV